jgi:hypothetical protein
MDDTSIFNDIQEEIDNGRLNWSDVVFNNDHVKELKKNKLLIQ